MKEKRLLKALGKVDGKYIEEASPCPADEKTRLVEMGGYGGLPLSCDCRRTDCAEANEPSG